MDKDRVYSTCGEVFNDDQPDYDVGDLYYSGYKKKIIPSSLLYVDFVGHIVANMQESLYEEVGEVAEDGLTLSDTQQKGLAELIKKFMDEHVEISCYAVTDIEEHTVEGDL